MWNTAPSAAVTSSWTRRVRPIARRRQLRPRLGAADAGAPPSIEASGARRRRSTAQPRAPGSGGQCRQASSGDDVTAARLVRRRAGGIDAAFTSLRGVLPKVLSTSTSRPSVIDRSPCDVPTAVWLRRSAADHPKLGQDHEIRRHLRRAGRLPRARRRTSARFGGAAATIKWSRTRIRGLPRYTIVVDPRLSGIKDGDVADTFLREMAGVERHYGFMAAVWARSKILTVRREAPLAGSSGKMLPFYRKG